MKKKHKGTVLIVEDDEATATLLNDVLAERGFELLHAREGGEALRMIHDHEPQAIMLDLALPGIDGRSFLMGLRSNDATKRTPVIVVSANCETLSTFERRAVTRIVTKPFDVGELVTIVEQVAAEAAAASSAARA
jgi:DNA-binding response OmpR family regulator